MLLQVLLLLTAHSAFAEELTMGPNDYIECNARKGAFVTCNPQKQDRTFDDPFAGIDMKIKLKAYERRECVSFGGMRLVYLCESFDDAYNEMAKAKASILTNLERIKNRVNSNKPLSIEQTILAEDSLARAMFLIGSSTPVCQGRCGTLERLKRRIEILSDDIDSSSVSDFSPDLLDKIAARVYTAKNAILK